MYAEFMKEILQKYASIYMYTVYLNRQICFKVKDHRYSLTVKRPRNDTIIELEDSRHGSKHSVNSMA